MTEVGNLYHKYKKELTDSPPFWSQLAVFLCKAGVSCFCTRITKRVYHYKNSMKLVKINVEFNIRTVSGLQCVFLFSFTE